MSLGAMAQPETGNGVEELRMELAREREELARTVDRLERSAAHARHRLVTIGVAVASSVVLACALAVLVRAGLRRRARPRGRVVARIGDLVIVRKGA
jgi:hypothetical protein